MKGHGQVMDGVSLAVDTGIQYTVYSTPIRAVKPQHTYTVPW